MTKLSAEPLSPIDAATLWPQLHRLDTEVIATRSGENLLVSSGVAATGLSRLPRVPKTIVMGVQPGLAYRGVLVARQLGGGVAWEVHSLRLARDIDAETVTALLTDLGPETTSRGARTIYLRYSESSPHEQPVLRAGFAAYSREQLYAAPPGPVRNEGDDEQFRRFEEKDAAALFRLYCRAVPEPVRRREAVTEEEWRGVLDSYDSRSEYVIEGEGGLVAWVGIGEREARVLTVGSDPRVTEMTLAQVTAELGRSGVLVVQEYQESLARAALAHEFTPLGVRVVSVRTLARKQPLGERVPVQGTPLVR